MSNLAICQTCHKKNNYIVKKVKSRYSGDGYDFEIDENGAYCEECNNRVWVDSIDNANIEIVNQMIREARKIITSKQIVELLNRYNASQKFLSKLLGWGEITLTRYITAGYTPKQAYSNQLKKLSNPYIFKMLLEQKLEEIEENIREEKAFIKIEERVDYEIAQIEQRKKIYRVTNWFLNQSDKENPITHLALQKLLYFVQGWNKVLNGEWMFTEDCEAWIHGAVYKDIYDEFRTFGYNPLPIIEKGIYFSENELQILEGVKKYYFNIYNAKTLETICHKEKPYLIAREGYEDSEASNVVMSKLSIADYYNEIKEEHNIKLSDMSGMQRYLCRIVAD